SDESASPAPVPQPTGSKLKSEFADDADMRAVLAEFIADLPGQVSRIAGLVEEGNVEELRRMVHRLKGAGGGYGFPRITQAAGAAEQRVKECETVEEVGREVEALIELVRSVEGYDPSRETRSVAKSACH